MIATVQPFGLSTPSGGSRILRALLAGYEEPFLSVCTAISPAPPAPFGEEVFLPLRPHFGRIESTRLYKQLWRIAPLYAKNFERRLETLFRARDVRAVHAIPHGLDFYHAFVVARRLDLRYVLNCHDELEYNLRGRYDRSEAERRMAQVWREADARLVISEAMGDEYCRRFGQRSWEMVTDGLTQIPDAPVRRPAKHLRVYFAGAVHLSYYPNFHALADALSRFASERPDWSVSLTVRGHPPEMSATIPITILPWGTEADVARDIESADLLYLPLPFGSRDASFTRLSLSTKLITYLGTGLPILYHGPEDAAAGRLLAQHQAAIAAPTLNAEIVANDLAQQWTDANAIACEALKLGRDRFLLKDQQRRFRDAMDKQVAAVKRPVSVS